ncbi:unnamed protein product [Peniophora sp. CBMAI 1063]|nr:unnamed protein product [Peniophora sp. CBMAI 1063]
MCPSSAGTAIDSGSSPLASDANLRGPVLEPRHQILKSFTSQEIMRWPAIGQVYGSFLRETGVFKVDKHWEDPHIRIIEHNIRIIATYTAESSWTGYQRS